MELFTIIIIFILGIILYFAKEILSAALKFILLALIVIFIIVLVTGVSWTEAWVFVKGGISWVWGLVF